jgi:predicted PurR-regulated permease PerM
MIPTTYDSIKTWIDELFEKLNYQNSIDFLKIKEELLSELGRYGQKFAESLPDIVISAISSFISGIGTIFVSLVIGFFLIIGFENTDAFIEYLPKKIQNNTRELLFDVNLACRSFVTGSFLDCIFIFLISSIGLYFVGLKAPLLFGLFCGITNIIPYLGPYLGGIPAVIIGFTQGTSVGILTLLVIAIIQLLEGNLLQPIILSKTTKLHPITIMLGLLVFGHFFGIIGMVISTPLLAAFKAIILFFDKKYAILDIN